MTDPRLEDHVVGLELQLVELVEQKQRAEVQGRTADAARLEEQVNDLQLELASAAEQLSASDGYGVAAGSRPDVEAPHAQELVDH